MRKTLLLILSVFLIFSVTGCKDNTLSEEDIREVIEENALNILNEENCGYKGEEEELEIDNITIEKSNIFEDDASADVFLKLKGDKINAEFYYRFDLVREKKEWKLKKVKNYKSYVIMPAEGISNTEVMEFLEEKYSDEYAFKLKSNEFDDKKRICSVSAEFIKEGSLSNSEGTVDIKYIFDEKSKEWAADEIKENLTKTEDFGMEGQWRFKDGVYFYRINIEKKNEETVELSYIVSEYESVIDTAEFEESLTLSITPNNDRVYIEPFEIINEEEKIHTMLYSDEDGLYFCTDYMSEYEKVNLSRYIEKTY